MIVFPVHFLKFKVHFLADLVKLFDFWLEMHVFLFQLETLFIEFLDLNLVTEIILKLSFGVFEFDPEGLNFDWESLDFNGLENNDHIKSFGEVISFVAGEVLYAGSEIIKRLLSEVCLVFEGADETVFGGVGEEAVGLGVESGELAD